MKSGIDVHGDRKLEADRANLEGADVFGCQFFFLEVDFKGMSLVASQTR